MAGKNTTYVADQVAIVMDRNTKGQVGIRKRFLEIAEKLDVDLARKWILEHVEQTRWFRALFGANDWAVADTETTGTGVADQICELAIVRPDRVAFSRMLRPTVPISPGASEKHGITSEMVVGLPTFGEVQAEIEKSFSLVEPGEAPITRLLWYNGEFDIRLKRQTAFAHRVPDPKWPEYVEVMERVGVWCGSWNAREISWRWPKLEGGHRAQGDCEYLIKYMRVMGQSDDEFAMSLYEETAPANKDGET